MAVTVQQITSQLDLFRSAADPIAARMQALLQQAQSLDINAPGAKDQISKIKVELDVLRTDWNNSAQPAFNDAVDLRNQASRSVQNQVDNSIDSGRALFGVAVSDRDAIRAILSAKSKEIDSLATNPQAAPGSTSVTPGATGPTTTPTTSGSGQPAAGTGDKSQNAANDDKSAGLKPDQNQQPSQGTGTDKKPGPGAAGPTTPSNNSVQDKPGKRLFNPLGEFPNYTYQISLYIISPDAYDAFISSGRRDINAIRNAGTASGDSRTSGSFLLVQSGGIENDALRADGFELDYYIDDLRIVTATSGKDTMTATNVTDIQFKVIEPYGFSFISNLKRASEQLKATSNTANLQRLENATKQFFMLGIRFQGLDSNGRPITSKESNSGLNIKVGTDGSGIYERFYDIMITSISFKLDGKATVYSIQARSIAPTTALGMARGICDTGCTLQGSKVGELLEQFATYLNEYNATQAGLTGALPNTFEFDFIGTDEDIQSIKDATIVSPADLDKLTWAGSNAKTTSESNAATAENATPQAARRTFVVERGEPIVQAVQRLISQSSYLEKALIEVQKNALQPSTDGKPDYALPPSQSSYVSWYNLSVECTKFTYDPKFAKFACNTKFVLQTYQTPVIQNSYTQLGVPYYGPHKRYDYYFTGNNTEVLSYTQNLDNTYFNVALIPPEGDQDSAAKGGAAQITVEPGKVQAAPKSGKYPLGAEAISAYMTDLYDPKAYAEAKLMIMGDPDYLMPDQSTSVKDIYNRFYNSDGFTINANGGQVFIEIDFKEARDYGFRRTGVSSTGKITGTELTNQGLMTINESIRFWRYPDKIAQMVKGVSYMVRSVTSIFNGGVFRQELDLNINTFPGVAEERANDQNPTTTPQSQQAVGTPKAQPVSPSGGSGLPAPPEPWGTAYGAGDRDAPWAKSLSRDGLIEGLNRELAANLKIYRGSERGKLRLIKAFERRRQNILKRFPNG